MRASLRSDPARKEHTYNCLIHDIHEQLALEIGTHTAPKHQEDSIVSVGDRSSQNRMPLPIPFDDLLGLQLDILGLEIHELMKYLWAEQLGKCQTPAGKSRQTSLHIIESPRAT